MEQDPHIQLYKLQLLCSEQKQKDLENAYSEQPERLLEYRSTLSECKKLLDQSSLIYKVSAISLTALILGGIGETIKTQNGEGVAWGLGTGLVLFTGGYFYHLYKDNEALKKGTKPLNHYIAKTGDELFPIEEKNDGK